jgi:hypothetical protein
MGLALLVTVLKKVPGLEPAKLNARMKSRMFYILVATPKQWEKPSSSVRKNSVWP